jgi:hypothetical protein
VACGFEFAVPVVHEQRDSLFGGIDEEVAPVSILNGVAPVIEGRLCLLQLAMQHVCRAPSAVCRARSLIRRPQSGGEAAGQQANA